MWGLFHHHCCVQDTGQHHYIELEITSDYHAAVATPVKSDSKIANPGGTDPKTLLSVAPMKEVAAVVAFAEETVEPGGEYTMAPIRSLYETDRQTLVRLERERSEADASSQADLQVTTASRESHMVSIRAEVDRARELLGLPPKLPIHQGASLPTHGAVAEQSLEPSAVFMLQQGLETSANSMCNQIETAPFSTEMPPDVAWRLPSADLLALTEVMPADVALQLPSADLLTSTEVAWSSRSPLVYEGTSEPESQREPANPQGEVPAEEVEVLSREEQKARLKEEIAALREKVRQSKNNMLAEKLVRHA